MKKLKIGLYGFGVVGQGLYNALQKSKTVDANIKAICVKHEKKRNVEKKLLTKDTNLILNDKEINVVVELINNADDSYQIVKKSLKKGKHVVSGNKKMLAVNLEELIELQEQTGKSLLYDASACGSIPVIRNLEEYYDNDLLISVTGILNGFSNYILTKIFREGKSYDVSLKEARKLGFAESNPASDVNGSDSLYKLIIITLHALGLVVKPENIFRFGIENISSFDIRFAKEKNMKIKLVSTVVKHAYNKVAMYVSPALVNSEKYIYNFEDEYNGVVIKGEFYDKQFMFGKGAGAFPTGSAVLSDITALNYNYKYEYKKLKYFEKNNFSNNYQLKIYLRYDEEEHLKLFQFEKISEKYSGNKTNYIIGTVYLDKLVKIKEIIKGLPLFLCVIN
jgi:homoserine dehydrogenase